MANVKQFWKQIAVYEVLVGGGALLPIFPLADLLPPNPFQLLPKPLLSAFPCGWSVALLQPYELRRADLFRLLRRHASLELRRGSQVCMLFGTECSHRSSSCRSGRDNARSAARHISAHCTLEQHQYPSRALRSDKRCFALCAKHATHLCMDLCLQRTDEPLLAYSKKSGKKRKQVNH